MDKPKQTTKKQIITIVGAPGSGKSTTAKAIAQKLGYAHFSTGDFFRKLAKQMGESDLTRAMRNDKINDELDRLTDGKLQEINASQEKVVIDSRMGPHFIPGSFKVFLKLDLALSAQRILNDLSEHRKKIEHIPDSPEKYAELLAERMQVDAGRYKLLYDFNPYDTANYELVVDTATHNIEETVALIIASYHIWLKPH